MIEIENYIFTNFDPSFHFPMFYSFLYIAPRTTDAEVISFIYSFGIFAFLFLLFVFYFIFVFVCLFVDFPKHNIQKNLFKWLIILQYEFLCKVFSSKWNICRYFAFVSMYRVVLIWHFTVYLPMSKNCSEKAFNIKRTKMRNKMIEKRRLIFSTTTPSPSSKHQRYYNVYMWKQFRIRWYSFQFHINRINISSENWNMWKYHS